MTSVAMACMLPPRPWPATVTRLDFLARWESMRAWIYEELGAWKKTIRERRPCARKPNNEAQPAASRDCAEGGKRARPRFILTTSTVGHSFAFGSHVCGSMCRNSGDNAPDAEDLGPLPALRPANLPHPISLQ